MLCRYLGSGSKLSGLQKNAEESRREYVLGQVATIRNLLRDQPRPRQLRLLIQQKDIRLAKRDDVAIIGFISKSIMELEVSSHMVKQS
jgi:hypothetical protein